MKNTLRYLAAWLLMPILAIRHKVLHVSHYEIVSDKFKTQKHPNYIEANSAFDSLVETDRYGEFIRLVEHRRGKPEEVISKLEW